jgi:uncharacterized protein (DUF488 family)
MSEDGAAAKAERCALKEKALYTIGYGARSIEQFVAVLKANEIECLIDVRSAPYSKFKQEFSKELLQYHIERAGIAYLFMGDTLGGQPKDHTCHTEGKVDYEKLRTRGFFQAGIKRLKEMLPERGRMALMCSEGKPEQCHRSKLLGEVLTGEEVPVWHIDEDGVRLTQQQVIDRLTHGQLDLFGQSFTSRKRYGPQEEEG